MGRGPEAPAYRETVELHVGQVNQASSLRFTCAATGIRSVVDAALHAVRGLDHPTTPAEQAAPVATLEARFPRISDGLGARTRIPLTVSGPAADVVTVETRH
ncbi:hypothetical protein [Actinophytocola sediminis]